MNMLSLYDYLGYPAGSALGKEVCDLDTGDCYTIREKDGLIERVDNTMKTNKRIQVETKTGIKQLLNG